LILLVELGDPGTDQLYTFARPLPEAFDVTDMEEEVLVEVVTDAAAGFTRLLAEQLGTGAGIDALDFTVSALSLEAAGKPIGRWIVDGAYGDGQPWAGEAQAWGPEDAELQGRFQIGVAETGRENEAPTLRRFTESIAESMADARVYMTYAEPLSKEEAIELIHRVANASLAARRKGDAAPIHAELAAALVAAEAVSATLQRPLLPYTVVVAGLYGAGEAADTVQIGCSHCHLAAASPDEAAAEALAEVSSQVPGTSPEQFHVLALFHGHLADVPRAPPAA
jgi:hypothetical protein